MGELIENMIKERDMSDLSKSRAKLSSLLVAGVLAVGISGTAFADETVAPTETTDTPVISETTETTPIVPTESDTTTTDTPVVPDSGNGGTGDSTVTPDTPVVPSEDPDKGNNDNGTTEPTTPTTDDKTNENTSDSSNGSNGKTDENKDNTTPSVTPVTPTPSNQTAGQAQQNGQSQIGTHSEVTGQTVIDPRQNNVVTPTGDIITGTDSGNLVITHPNTGLTETVAPEAIGARTNSDGTISVKDKDGEDKTLPNTGVSETISIILSSMGAFLMLFGMVFLRPSGKK